MGQKSTIGDISRGSLPKRHYQPRRFNNAKTNQSMSCAFEISVREAKPSARAAPSLSSQSPDEAESDSD